MADIRWKDKSKITITQDDRLPITDISSSNTDGYTTPKDIVDTGITTNNLTESTSAVLTITGGTNSVVGTGTTIAVKQSSTSVSGYLTSTDWNTFNNKQAALTFGVADTNAVKINSTTINSGEYAYFTSTGE